MFSYPIRKIRVIQDGIVNRIIYLKQNDLQNAPCHPFLSSSSCRYSSLPSGGYASPSLFYKTDTTLSFLKDEYKISTKEKVLIFDIGDRTTYVNEEDFEKFKNLRWFLTNEYAGVCIGRTTRRVHRLIMDAPEDKVVDHINRNRLDNRRENLRVVSTRENNLNRKGKSNCKSGYNGIMYYDRWQVNKNFGGRKRTFCFKTEQEAQEFINQNGWSTKARHYVYWLFQWYPQDGGKAGSKSFKSLEEALEFRRAVYEQIRNFNSDAFI